MFLAGYMRDNKHALKLVDPLLSRVDRTRISERNAAGLLSRYQAIERPLSSQKQNIWLGNHGLRCARLDKKRS
jgi:hypothetical protein